MIYNSFSDEELSLIGKSVAGTFHHHEVDGLIFSSHSWPSHRIAIDRQAARDYIEGVVKQFGEHCQAD
jgi:hypothetical protein